MLKVSSIPAILSHFHSTKCMKAKFKTTCISCNGEINPGKEIAKNDSGSWVHKHCLTESVELP